MRKLTIEIDGEELEQSPRAVFEHQIMRSGTPRVVTYVPNDKADLLRRLSVLLPEPFYVLYILHTSRGQGELGRYQSAELSRAELDQFLVKYEPFFADDARHDVWVYSPSSGRTLIWDRHNLLFAEGEPLDDVITSLVAQGFEAGSVEPLDCHFHHYRQEYDEAASSLLAELDWYRTPLRPEDEQ